MSGGYWLQQDVFDLTEAELHLASPCHPDSRCTVCYPQAQRPQCSLCAATLIVEIDGDYSSVCAACRGLDDKRGLFARREERVDPQTGFIE